MSTVPTNAIQTHYAGHKFRSRLEARWAVFFDALETPWQYEPEGYMVGWPGHQRPYLPDFYLPSSRLWVEVKGSSGQADNALLVDAAVPHYGLPDSPDRDAPLDPSRAGRRLLTLGQIPPDVAGVVEHRFLSFWKGDVSAEWGFFYGYGGFTTSPFNEATKVGDDSSWADPTVDLVSHRVVPHERALNSVRRAYTKARKARFEHGEKG